MTLGEKVSMVAFISERESKIKKLTVGQLNNILKLIDYDLIKEVYGQPGDPGGYAVQGQISEALLPFTAGPTSIALTSGTGILPPDFYHFVDCYYDLGGDHIRIARVETQEASVRKENSIKKPTGRHPIVELFPTQLKVSPTTITPAFLTYIKRPIPALYVVKIENAIQVYDSDASTQTQWGAEKHIDLIRLILKYIGISLGNQQIINYIEQRTQAEN